MDERTLIGTYLRRSRQGPPAGDVLLGIGDDAAVLRLEPGFDLVVATDSIAEGTHFPAGTPAAAIGHRCLAVNLSDMAAMAAEPLWFSLALSLPQAEPCLGRANFRGACSRWPTASALHWWAVTPCAGPLGATVTVHGRCPARARRDASGRSAR